MSERSGEDQLFIEQRPADVDLLEEAQAGALGKDGADPDVVQRDAFALGDFDVICSIFLSRGMVSRASNLATERMV